MSDPSYRNILIRQARSGDEAAIASVLIKSIREVCGPDYDNDESVLSHWCANKKPELIAKWIVSPSQYFIVALIEEEIVGVGDITFDGKILLCYVHPEFIGKGVGKSLLDAMTGFARERSINKITLESTRTALSFYERNGFTNLGPTSDGRVPGFAMEKFLYNKPPL